MTADPTDDEIRAFLVDPALQETAERMARAIADANAAPAESRPRIIVFRVGLSRLALPLASVREVVLPVRLSRVPRAPEAVLGIMNLRGRVVAVVDLLLCLPGELGARARGDRPVHAGEPLGSGRILLLERGRREIGLLVREVEGIAPADAAGGDGAVLLDPEELARSLEALVD